MADPIMFPVVYEDRDYATGVARPTDAAVEIYFKVEDGEQLQYSGLQTFGINTTKPFRGKLVDGVLEKRGGGTLQLVANDPALGLDRLVYTIKFLNPDVDGVPVVIDPFDFEAPPNTSQLDLNTVSPVVGNTEGVARGPEGPPGDWTEAELQAMIDAAVIAGRGNSIVWMGDSMTERGSIPIRGSLGSVAIGGLVGMIHARVPSLWYRYNAAIGGQDTSEMVARWAADVVPWAPTAVHIEGGGNDVTGSVAQADSIANLRFMIRDAKRIGAIVFLGTIIPRSDSPSIRDNIDRLNVEIRRLAAVEGAHLIDYYAVLVDPATGYYQAGLSDDTIHPNDAGNTICADLAAAVMNRVLPQGGLPVAMSQYSGQSNRVANCMMLDDTNADGVPDFWSAGGTATTSTISCVTDPDFLGKALQIEFTGASGRFVQCSAISTSLIPVGWDVAFCGKYTADVEAGAGTYRIELQFTGSTETNYTRLRPVYDLAVDTDGVGYFYIEGEVPVGTTSMTVLLVALTGAGTIKLGQVALWAYNNGVIS